MDLLTFGGSFGGSLGDDPDEELSSPNSPDVPLPVNLNLHRNPLGAQPTDLDTESIADFNAMRSSVPPESDTDKPRPYARWEHVSTFSLRAFTPGFNKIRKSIKSSFLISPKPWQVSMVADIIQTKRDVVVIAGSSAGKILPYQSIPLITGGIVLVVSPTIALMEDQVS